VPVARHRLVHGLDADELGEQHGRRHADDEGGVLTADLPRGAEQHRGTGTHRGVHDGRGEVDWGIEVSLERRSFSLCRPRCDRLPMGAAISLPTHEPGVQVHGPTQQTARRPQQDQRRDVHGLPRVMALTPGSELADTGRA
jgi:hypothetical protein